MAVSTSSGVELTKKSVFYQYLATVSACLSVVICGMHFAWPSPTLPQLSSPHSQIPITSDEGSWIAATPSIGDPWGSILAAIMIDKIGRKTCILISSPLYFLSWIIVAYSPSVLVLCTARFLAGISDGFVFAALPMYVGEIADAKIRGLLCSSIHVSLILGMLLINVVGSSMDMKHTALVSSVVPVLLFCTFWFMPESPYYLVMKDKIEEAKQSLRKLNSSEEVTEETNLVMEAVREDQKQKGKFYELFTLASNRKAVLVVFGLRGIQQLSGNNIINFYATTIFNEAGTDIPSSLDSNIFFLVQLVIAILASWSVDKLGRKPLLITSIIGSGLALSLEGIYFYLADYTMTDVTNFKFVPIVVLFGYAGIFNFGMGTVPVLLSGEMFPTSVKAFAMCLAGLWFDMTVVLVSKFFQIMKDDFGIHVPFFAFAGVCGGGLIFIVFLVPETKGKTLEEIQHYLKRKRSKEEDSNCVP